MIVDQQPYRTDEQLALAVRSDTQVLGEIIERYEPKLDRYIARKSSADTSDRKDILQNIFIKVYKNINDFDTSLTFSSWIYRIAHNEMIDWYRRERRRPHLSLEGSDGILETIRSEISASELVEKEELRRMIQKTFETLPEKYQSIAELRFFEEKSYDEIADILAIPPGTVAIRISRVKKMLSEQLSSYGKQP